MSQKPNDTEMLDWLEQRVEGYGAGVVCRNSTTGRGFRLHEVGDDYVGLTGRTPQPTVREAIADAMLAELNKE